MINFNVLACGCLFAGALLFLYVWKKYRKQHYLTIFSMFSIIAFYLLWATVYTGKEAMTNILGQYIFWLREISVVPASIFFLNYIRQLLSKNLQKYKFIPKINMAIIIFLGFNLLLILFLGIHLIPPELFNMFFSKMIIIKNIFMIFVLTVGISLLVISWFLHKTFRIYLLLNISVIISVILTITDLLMMSLPEYHIFSFDIVDFDLFALAAFILSLGILLTTYRQALEEAKKGELYQKQLLDNEEKLGFLSNHDPLTGLLNREALYSVLISRLNQDLRSRPGISGALMYIDIDAFQEINQAFGQEIGDKIIKEASERLKKRVRVSDTLFRAAGDEFYLILDEISETTDAAIIANELLQTMSEPFIFEKDNIYIQISIGISVFPNDSNDANELIQMSGEALQEAKRRKNTYKFFTDALQKSSQKRLNILRQIREGLNENTFELYYQPIVNRKGRLVSAEALLRLRSKENIMINPSVFIPVAESSGLIYSLSEWVLERAVIDTKQFRKINKKFYVSINLSVKQFTDPNLIVQVESIFRKFDFPAEGVRFEITEYSLAEEIEVMGQKLRDLIDMGVHFSIDDFGTGFSSMSYLKNLPASNLKIDRSFVENIQHSDTDRAIVCSIIELARGLSMKVIAEGVENKKQLEFLIRNNCDYIQGYYYGKPVPFEVFVEKYLENSFENVFTSL